MRKLIIFGLLIVILLSLYLQYTKIKEGYVNYMMANPDMVKKITVVDDSTRKSVLSEIYENVRKHEIILKTHDKTYRYENVQQNIKNSNMQNIYALFPILKKQDNELVKLTKTGNVYVQADTLDDLINGNLTNQYIRDLEKLRDYKPPSMLPKKVVDADEMRDIASEYREKAAMTPYESVKKSLLRKADEWEEKAVKKELEGIPEDNANIPIDSDPIISQDAIDSNAEMLFMYYIVNIVKNQDQAINEIYNITEQSLFSIYPSLTNGVPDIPSM